MKIFHCFCLFVWGTLAADNQKGSCKSICLQFFFSSKLFWLICQQHRPPKKRFPWPSGASDSGRPRSTNLYTSVHKGSISLIWEQSSDFITEARAGAGVTYACEPYHSFLLCRPGTLCNIWPKARLLTNEPLEDVRNHFETVTGLSATSKIMHLMLNKIDDPVAVKIEKQRHGKWLWTNLTQALRRRSDSTVCMT